MILSAIFLGSTLAGCATKGDSATDSAADSQPPALEACQEVGAGLSSAFLSLWSDGDEAFLVGGDTGQGPAFYQLSGGAWSAVETGSEGDLWWVQSLSSDRVHAVGAAGRFLLYSPSTGELSEETLPGAEDYTLFGTWASSADDIWAVGGNVNLSPGSEGAGGVWRHDGQSWSQVELPAEASEQLVYKVWGQSADEVWFVGTTGLVFRWDGQSFSLVPTDSTRNLFTLSGQGEERWAVGGYGDGTLLRWDGTQWLDQTPDYAPQLNGIHATGSVLAACGRMGGLYRSSPELDSWEQQCLGATPYDYHACWADSDGGIWAVGGSISSSPLDQGVVIYSGPRDIPPLSF